MDNKIAKLIRSITDHAVRFDTYDNLEEIVKAAADKQFVLLGEASHGTSELARTFRQLCSDQAFQKI